MNIILYHLPGSRSQRVRWLLEELQLDYILRPVDLFKGEGNTPEYLAIHPLGQLPAIRLDDTTMFESGAIVQWLADTFPEKNFAPAIDSMQRQRYLQWLFFSATSLEAPAWEIILHRDILPEDQAIKTLIPFATRTLRRVLTVLEDEIPEQGYLLGNQFTAVDIMIGFILMWFPDQLNEFKKLKSYCERLQQRPAYIRSIK
jgi:glutathione S-transferase